MNAINSITAALVSAIMAALSALPPVVALILISAVSGVLAGLCFRYTSHQKGLKRAADAVRANLLAMRLFGDDVRAMFRAQGGLLKASIVRVGLSLPPMLVLIVPFMLLLTQLAMFYEFRPLRAGESALLTMTVDPARWDQLSELKPEPIDGVEFVGPVRDIPGKQLTWRIEASRPIGTSAIRWKLPGGEVSKSLAVADASPGLLPASPLRAGASFWDRVLYPAEQAFGPSDAIQQISVSYPQRSTPLLGWNVPWWLTFFVVSILGALLLKPFIKIQF